MEAKHPFLAEPSRPAPGLLHELVLFLAHQKKWWLVPVLAMLLLLGFLMALSASPVAPFIYTLF